MSYTNSYRRAFHGTSKAALERILKEGLIPGAGKGADYWASRHWQHYEPRGSVFLSYLSGIAATFSQFAAQVQAGDAALENARHPVEGGIVLEIDMSQAEPERIEADHQFKIKGDQPDKAFQYHGVIPASWLRCWHEVHPTVTELPTGILDEWIENPPLALGDPVPVAA